MEDRGRSRRRTQVRTAFDDRSREMSKERPRKKPSSKSAKARKKQRRRQVNTALSIVAVLAAGYFAVSLKYREAFLPNTSIGGISVAGMTVDEVKEEIRAGIDSYQLRLEERDGQEEVIFGRDIDLQPVYDGSLEQILEGQNSLLWGINWLDSKIYEQNRMVQYNEEKLNSLVNSLECMNPEMITEPVSAYLSYQEETGLTIVPEERGNAPIPERLTAEIKNAVSSLEKWLSLEERKVYREPEIFKDNPTLLEQKKQWERYAKVKVTYRFGSRSEVVDGTTILSWLSEGVDKNVTIDRTKVEEYVKGLAKTYNTAYHTKALKTSYGSTVKITQGNYGWMIDQKTEVEQLIQAIESGESQEREPVYLQTAASHDGPDYGDTYVEMNLTAQHLFYYKNGKLLIESDFVSGDEAKGWSTPAGAYELTYKQRDATLKGKNYKTPVTYWMPFNGNIGMHDGYWRSSFGGTIYKKNGSHGCVNLPPAVAKIIFENIEKGIPVLCYHLEGTQTNKTTKDSSGKTETSGKERETTAAQSTSSAATEPATAPTIAPAETTPASSAAIPEPASAAENAQTGELGPAGETASLSESPAGTADAPNSNISMEGPGVVAPAPGTGQ